MKNYKLFLIVYLPILFFFLLFINLYYLEGIPHVPDDAAYLFMAKIFASGYVILPIPVSPEHFNFFPGILSVEKGMWLFQYPFGHPLLLAIGVLIGFPNLIPPLIGILFVLVLSLTAKEIYNEKTAIFVSILPFLSPFFLENAASFMSHSTAAFYLISSLYCLILSLKNNQKPYLAVLSGVLFGLLFNTRPLVALPFILIFLIIIFSKQKSLRKILRTSLYFLSGLFFLICLWLAYNYLTTGNALFSQYYEANKSMIIIGKNETLITFFQTRFANTQILFNNFGPMLFNWPIFITYGLLLVPFILRQNILWDNILFISLFILPVVYFFYDGQFLMYGPRFWYEITPSIFLLTGRSFALLSRYLPKETSGVFIILVLISLGKLFSVIPTKDPDMMSPLALERLRGINVVDSRIIKIIRNNNLHHAVVFVRDCGIYWWCYGSVFPQNSPKLDTDIIYAKDLGDLKNQTLMQYFKDRIFYRIDYYNLALERINTN